jgi:hypothetical protein
VLPTAKTPTRFRLFWKSKKKDLESLLLFLQCFLSGKKLAFLALRVPEKKIGRCAAWRRVASVSGTGQLVGNHDLDSKSTDEFLSLAGKAAVGNQHVDLSQRSYFREG